MQIVSGLLLSFSFEFCYEHEYRKKQSEPDFPRRRWVRFFCCLQQIQVERTKKENEQKGSTVPNRKGAAVIKWLLDLRDYQVCGDWPGSTCQRGDCQGRCSSFRIPHR